MNRIERESTVVGILGLGATTTLAVLALRGGPAVAWLRVIVELWLPLAAMTIAGTAIWIWSIQSRTRSGSSPDDPPGPEPLPSAGFEAPRHGDHVEQIVPHAHGRVGALPVNRRVCLMVKPHGSNEYWLQCGGPLARQRNGTWHGHSICVGNEDSKSGSGFDLSLVLVTPKALAVIERHHLAGRGTTLPPGAAIIETICVYRS